MVRVGLRACGGLHLKMARAGLAGGFLVFCTRDEGSGLAFWALRESGPVSPASAPKCPTIPGGWQDVASHPGCA
jgi:hypothetical protein